MGRNISRMWLLFTAVALAGCASSYGPSVSVPSSVFHGPPPPEAQVLWDRADSARRAGDIPRALRIWSDLAREYPYHSIAPRAIMETGNVYLEQGQARAALEAFEKILENFPLWRGVPVARASRLSALLKTGAVQRVLQEGPGLWTSLAPYPKVRVHVAQVMAEASMKSGSPGSAFQWLDRGFDVAEDAEDVDFLSRWTSSYLERMDAKSLEEMLATEPSDRMKVFFQYQLARWEMEQGRAEAARDRLLRISAAGASHPLAPEIREMLAQMPGGTGPGEADPRRIGCLAPINGPYGRYGRMIVRGFTLTVEDWNRAHPEDPVTLVVKDTRAEPETALKALRELVEEEKVLAVVGPLSRESAARIASQGDPGVPVLSLTRREERVAANPFVINVFLNEREMLDTLVEYCVERLGYGNFAVLYPNDRSGNRLASLFEDSVRGRGAQVLASEAYGENTTDFKQPIGELVSAVAGRPSGDYGGKGIEGLFIPDQAQTVSLIAPQLLYNNLVGTTLLGHNLWAEVDLVEVGGVYMDQALFVTPFYRDGDSPRVRAFRDRVTAVYGSPPSYLEAQAYDALSMLLVARRDLPPSTLNPFALLQSLLSIRDYEGLAGVYSFNASGELRRTYTILQVVDGRVVQRFPETDVPSPPFYPGGRESEPEPPLEPPPRFRPLEAFLTFGKPAL